MYLFVCASDETPAGSRQRPNVGAGPAPPLRRRRPIWDHVDAVRPEHVRDKVLLAHARVADRRRAKLPPVDARRVTTGTRRRRGPKNGDTSMREPTEPATEGAGLVDVTPDLPGVHQWVVPVEKEVQQRISKNVNRKKCAHK